MFNVLFSRQGVTGLQSDVLPDFFYQTEWLGKFHGETVPPVKLAEDSFTDRVD